MEIHSPGPWFDIKMSSYQCRKCHFRDKMIARSCDHLISTMAFPTLVRPYLYIECGPCSKPCHWPLLAQGIQLLCVDFFHIRQAASPILDGFVARVTIGHLFLRFAVLVRVTWNGTGTEYSGGFLSKWLTQCVQVMHHGIIHLCQHWFR